MKRITPQEETSEQKQNRETVEGIATNITKLTEAVGSLLNGPLKRKTIVTLLVASTKLAKDKVESVLGALEHLHKDWINE